MPNYKQILGDTVRSARIKLGLTQAQVADSINIDVRTIMHIENYKGNPTMEILFPLLNILRIDPLRLIYPESDTDGEALRNLSIILADCTTEEISSLIPICETTISVLRARSAINIE